MQVRIDADLAQHFLMSNWSLQAWDDYAFLV
jgi:hypothetical protein